MKDHVGRDFAKDERDEEDGGDDVVLDTLEVQVNGHTFDLGISYVKSAIGTRAKSIAHIPMFVLSKYAIR